MFETTSLVAVKNVPHKILIFGSHGKIASTAGEFDIIYANEVRWS